ncbi:hypothetical protein F0169_14955 [Pseudomonas sp. MAFF 212408]|uniref:Uncharacterized protein n=1 Tax=Pseudomonas kitaguniensis TaxID=2607908 RepID=A0A5N7KNB5_9PSED|nr:hypothetical protein [Pseudomonas kitaguniensis]MPR03255.1 hypothetical protein [Pseudomonas kitaguniensis]
MKTRSSQRILLIVGFSAVLSGPAFAAFGDSPNPSATAVSGANAAGSALPPGTYPSSPADSDKKTTTPPKDQKAPSAGTSTHKPSDKKPKKATPAP